MLANCIRWKSANKNVRQNDTLPLLLLFQFRPMSRVVPVVFPASQLKRGLQSLHANSGEKSLFKDVSPTPPPPPPPPPPPVLSVPPSNQPSGSFVQRGAVTYSPLWRQRRLSSHLPCDSSSPFPSLPAIGVLRVLHLFTSPSLLPSHPPPTPPLAAPTPTLMPSSQAESRNYFFQPPSPLSLITAEPRL